MPEEQSKSRILGGSLLLKILILAGVGLIVSVFLFGVQLTLPDLFWAFMKILIGIVLIVFVIKGIESFLPQNRFSPTRRFKEKIERTALIAKPFNVKELYIRGEDMRVYSYWGKIVGLLFIPYLIGAEKRDADGRPIYEPRLDKEGKEVKTFVDFKTQKKIMVNAREAMNEKDGDWLFVVKRGIIPFFSKNELVRAHVNYCSDMAEKVWIKTINLVPIGDYFYPVQMWSKDIGRIKLQHQAETLTETYQEFLDLLANITETSIKSDPQFQKIERSNTESINQTDKGILTRG